MYNLRRISDGAGDSGISSEAISWTDDGYFKEIVSNKPTIGCSMRVGSGVARSFINQDYWMTTPVTEIIDEVQTPKSHWIKFRTGNSIYEWWWGEKPKM